MTIDTISINDFRALYEQFSEFAVIDPREELLFARGHLFGATNMPLSRLELRIFRGVPNLDTPIILCDDGEGTSERATTILAGIGYSNLSVLAGGLPAWALMGGAIFSGMNVPSKAFGEAVERDLNTKTISAIELKGRMDSGKPLLLLDARPEEEHSEYCIPGSVCCPSAEMVLRCGELEISADTDVVVHCAGRTRSIIGAQTLIDSGLFRNVSSLCNGTPAWEFEGWETEKGNTDALPLPSGVTASASAQAAAVSLRAAWGLEELKLEQLEKVRESNVTCYLFDIRSSEEFSEGHLSGSTHIVGGQLLQTTERNAVVQNAHIILIDSNGIRATTTAVWLKRMGWKSVNIFALDDNDPALIAGPDTLPVPPLPRKISFADAIDALNANKATLCDLRPSYSYRRGHIKGSAFLTRADLANDAAQLPNQHQLILLADDLGYAAFTGRDLQELGYSVRLYDGCLSDWNAAGGQCSKGEGWLVSRPVDTYFESDHYDSQVISLREHHAYLNWEIALIDHIVDEPAVKFDIR